MAWRVVDIHGRTSRVGASPVERVAWPDQVPRDGLGFFRGLLLGLVLGLCGWALLAGIAFAVYAFVTAH
jgi:hypothetical protein